VKVAADHQRRRSTTSLPHQTRSERSSNFSLRAERLLDVSDAPTIVGVTSDIPAITTTRKHLQHLDLQTSSFRWNPRAWQQCCSTVLR